MKESLKLALSRLEWFIDAYPHDIAVSKEEFLRPFKEALAQPAQQEPVLSVVIREGLPTLLQDRDIKPTDTRLYTTPQRPWVGLADEEITKIFQRNGTPNGFARAIEKALKEKNT